ncbi:DMT family transporter [Niveibacterium terrae]|uniref:DMT family transporter n=1 Tax=Niveibacterium terrae TaxID=3373598 RepID=UPI003A93BF45
MPSEERLAPVIVQQLLVALIWGGTWIAGRLVSAELPPLAAAGWRFLFGSLTLGFLVWRANGGLPRIGPGDAVRVLAMGAFGIFAYNLCFFFGLKHVQAGRAALVVALNPVAVALAASFFGEKLARRKVLGIAVALAGCLLVISHGEPQALLGGALGLGELAILGCVASWTVYTLIGRNAGRSLAPLTMTFYASLAGGLLLALAGLGEGSLRALPHLSGQAWLSLVYLGVLGSGFSYVWYANGVMKLGAARAAAFINLVPICAVLLGAALLGERIDAMEIAGGALVLVGVWQTNRSKAEMRT